jgi:glycosyltransferase involved in cell wall biosynthesis
MKKDALLKNYFEKYAAGPPWQIQTENLDNIDQVVVIPAYAEREMLFATLASLAANPDAFLEKTLVLCVINNKEDASVADKENNAQTLSLLCALIGKQPFNQLQFAHELHVMLQNIAKSPLRAAFVDASSPGLEIPPRAGGVGMARKIGMDMALRLLAHSPNEPRLILSLDADTRVRPDYLSAIRNAFVSGKARTGIVAYEHAMPPEEIGQAAICLYEIFLRYWVLGLQYARSPYAFYSIGSTIVTTADSYLAVRGMNRRAAGEDFYFLNKLAKTGPVRQITETVVYPSARVSGRVPFGTGAAVEKIMSSADSGHLFYNPRVFLILKKWLALMTQSFHRSEQAILACAKEIDPGLASFLIARGFLSVWPKIRSNLKDEKTWNRQFHNWFDGFETLKLVNDLSRRLYPRMSLFSALSAMTSLTGGENPGRFMNEHTAKAEDLLRILQDLRRLSGAGADPASSG